MSSSWLSERLVTASPDGVWFASQGADEAIEEVRRKGMSVATLVLAGVEDDPGLFAALAAALRFPEYFGENWDAVDESLQDLDWLPREGLVVVVAHSMAAWQSAPETMGKLVSAWLAASARWCSAQRPFHLVFT